MLATLAVFSSQARGIMFYNVPSYVGQHFKCFLDPSNTHDVDAISLSVGPHQMLGHLAREASHFLGPLLREDFKHLGKLI
jgi:hypothetical protein